MDARYPKGLYLEAFGGPREDEFATWLLQLRLPRVQNSGWVDDGMLYESAEPDGAGPTYLAVFETSRWDLEDIVQELERPSGDAVRDRLEYRPDRIGWSRLLRRCGPPVPVDRSGFMADGRAATPTTALLVVWSRFHSPANEKPFNNWYNRRCVPAQVAEGTFARGYRYACAFREANGERRFAALYETDAGGPADINAYLVANGPAGAPGIEVPDYVEVLEHAIFLPVTS